MTWLVLPLLNLILTNRIVGCTVKEDNLRGEKDNEISERIN